MTKISKTFTYSPPQIEAMRKALSDRDPLLAKIHAVTPPFEWRVKQGGFIGLTRLIIEQQLSVASAAAIWKRFENGIGEVTSPKILRKSIDNLKTFGLSKQKALYIQAIAEAEVKGNIDFENLNKLDDDIAITELMKLKGVGRWTAEIYLMFCEGRVDLFPAGDLALRESVRLVDGAKTRLSEKELYARAERWRPYRGAAAHLLWAYYIGIKRAGILPDKILKKTKKKKR